VQSSIFATLAVCPGSFLDDELRSTHADVLYTVRTTTEQEALVYVLFEHQSSHDATMPFRLLRYMVRIWERWQRDHPGVSKLPLVLPLVLHNGETRWRSGRDFASMLDATPPLLAAARPFQPMFEIALDDLAILTAESILARGIHALGRLAQLGLWARSRERLESAVPAMRALARTLARDSRTRALLTQLYVYLWSTAPPEVDDEEIRAILLEVAGAEGVEDVVNAGDRLIAKGREQGLEKGLAGLRGGIETAVTARGLTLSDVARARLAACRDVVVLTTWLGRAVNARSEADVFAADDTGTA
jgi:hypothetical protein